MAGPQVKIPTQQSVVTAGASSVDGETQPRRAYYVADEELVGPPLGTNNLWESFLRGLKTSGAGDFLGRRPIAADGTAEPFVWESYETVHKRVMNLASGIKQLCELAPQENMGIYAVNRPEWTMTELACYNQNFVTVPLYDTLGEEAVEHVFNQTEMKVVSCSKDKIKKLLEMKDRIPHLKIVISMDDLTEAEVKELTQSSAGEWKIISFAEVEKIGSERTIEPERAAELDDLSVICYTSGTTGVPKGAMLTHRNFLSMINALRRMASEGVCFSWTKDEVYLSYLPLAHIMERLCILTLIFHGAQIGFYQGDTLKLLDDVQALKPTIFISVPRLFNRIYDKVRANVTAKGGIAAALFNRGFRAKKSNLQKNVWTHWLWDRLVFGAVRARLGGRVKAMLTGAAPIHPDVLDFLRICFGCYVHEGYGQTETTAAISATLHGDCTTGHLGVAFPAAEIKLLDVPSMNYTSKDEPNPRGEILVRGNNVFKGYYKCPDKTAETLDKDGWCHTGDIGEVDQRGRLKIIDRVKNIFKMAQGEYIAPEKIENVYAKHSLVAQAFVYGDSLKPNLVGIIVPDEETFLSWARGILSDSTKSFADICDEADEKVVSQLLTELVKIGKESGLKGFEAVKKLALEKKPFECPELLTPTFKLKRHDAKVKYQSKIDSLYAQLN